MRWKIVREPHMHAHTSKLIVSYEVISWSSLKVIEVLAKTHKEK